MKKRLIVLAVLLVVLLSGCDLRNRKPSEDFIPASHAIRTAAPHEETEEPVETVNDVKELTRHSIRTVFTESQTFRDIYGNDWTYDYRLPFVDFPTMEASRCNNEVDRLYRRQISSQKTLAETGQPLTVPKIDYECYYTGALITLNVWEETTEGEVNRTVYCFRSTGTMATATEILEAVWIEPEDFLDELQSMVKKQYKKENKDYEDDVSYQRYLDATLAMIENVDDVTLYADAEDNVFALVKMFDAKGVATQIEFEVDPG